MKKRVCLLFAFIFVLCTPFSTLAYHKDKHDYYLEQVLFGQTGYNGTDLRAKDAIIILNAACAVAIDQYNGSYKQELEYLRDYQVNNLPSSIDEINFTDGPDHRGKTHLGWDHKYPNTGKHAQAKWPVRKEILLSTVNKVFDFGFFSGWFGIYDEKCKSFSAFIYYVHILGDTIADKTEKSKHDQRKMDDLVLPVLVRQQSSVKPDILSELQKHIDILFDEQDHSELNIQFKQLRDNARYTTWIVDGEYSDTYYGYAEELMDILIKQIPKLLKNESFFNNVFHVK